MSAGSPPPSPVSGAQFLAYHTVGLPSELAARIALPLLLVGGAGIWSALWHGDRSWWSVLNVVGSVIGLLGVLWQALTVGSPTRLTGAPLIALVVVPTILTSGFLFYITFYLGLWGLVSMLWDFSLGRLSFSALCAGLGIRAARALATLTSEELHRAVLAAQDTLNHSK